MWEAASGLVSLWLTVSVYCVQDVLGDASEVVKAHDVARQLRWSSPRCKRDDCVARSMPMVSWVGCICNGLAEDDLRPLAHALDALGIAVSAWSKQ